MRKFLIYIVIMMASLLTCKAQKIEQESFCGTYYKLKKNKDFNMSYKLILNADSTFTLLVNTAAGKPQCDGVWKNINNEFIFLKCAEITDATDALTNSYMSQREHKLQIISKNKIKYKDVILKRKKK